ncbi:MAG: alpha-E domain-containing protein [Actinomycetia bacterium]|nr:alpha-E domain-containing protein [Actinomycetes bacterium]
MLARNAESLYWIGRYVERADDKARILDVTVHQILEDSSVDPDQASRTLLRVLGMEPPESALDLWSLTDLVAFSRDTDGRGGCSIVQAISAARENARGAREVTSTDIWECLNTTFNALPERERAARRLGPYEFLSYVEGRAAMFAGLADSTLARDDGYRFMVLGRAIERVDMTVRLLLSRVGDSASSPAWVTVLRAAGAHDTYLRTYRGVLDAARVVEFMLLDRAFPRSAVYSLRLAEHSLDELHKRRYNRIGATAEAQRLLGSARSELEFLPPGVLLESLEERLARIQVTCADVGEELAQEYFHSAPWVAWTDAGRDGALVIEEGEV